MLGGQDGPHLSFILVSDQPSFSCFLFLPYPQFVALGTRVCVDLFITITLCLEKHVECFRDIFINLGAYFYGWKLTRELQTYGVASPCLLLSYPSSLDHMHFLGLGPSFLTWTSWLLSALSK